MENFMVMQNSVVTLNISDKAYRIYSFLNSMCYGEKDYCYPSQEYISKQFHICVRTVQRAIKELVQAGLIKIKRRGSISNVYYLLKKVATKGTSKIKDTIEKVKGKIGKFNNFKQRNYNFKNLEDMLLGNKEYSSEELLE